MTPFLVCLGVFAFYAGLVLSNRKSSHVDFTNPVERERAMANARHVLGEKR